MKTHKNLPVHHECSSCSLRSNAFFCELPEPAHEEFASLKVTHVYPKGTILFVEGQPANGVYLLCSGKVKLSTYSEDGKSLILRIAEAGELLGLSATVAGIAFECSAEATADCQVNFIRGREFNRFLSENNAAAMNAIKDLSRTYNKAHAQVCSLGLSTSVSDKLARLFLSWYENSPSSGPGATIPVDFTHEDIAEMIGTSRETVTRLLKQFKKRNLIRLDRSQLYIPDKGRLKASIGSGTPSFEESCDDGHASM